MATGILQVTPIFLPLLGDGITTTFTIAPANIPFAGVPGLNPIVPLEGAFLHNETIFSSGLTGVCTVDAYGNLTITLSAPIPAGTTITPQIDLYVASGAVVATTTTWNNTTPINSTLVILLGVAIPTVNVAYNPAGTVFGGATVQFETSIDGGITWLPIFGTISTSGGVASSSLVLTGVASIIQFNVAGFTNFRVRLSTVITGAGVAEFALLGSKLATNVTISGGWVTGTLSENFAPPSNTNFGVLPAVASGTAPTLVDGNQVLLSTDLSGSLRVNGTSAVQGQYLDGTPISTPIKPVYVGGKGTDGNLHGLLTTVSGALVTVPEGLADSANHFAVTTGSTLVSVPGPLTPILSIRPQVAATVTFFLTGLDVFTAAAVAMFQVIKNGSLTGASFSNVTGSNAQQDTSATSVSGGTIMDTGYSTTGTRTQGYEVQFTVGDTFTLVVASDINGKATKAVGALRWAEQTQPL